MPIQPCYNKSMGRDTATQRFWDKVNKQGPRWGRHGRCWTWQGSTNNGYYGQFWDGTKLVYAHRYAYELLVGPILEGLTLDHLCRVRNCVRPSHLEAVTLPSTSAGAGMGGITPARRTALADTRCPARTSISSPVVVAGRAAPAAVDGKRIHAEGR